MTYGTHESSGQVPIWGRTGVVDVKPRRSNSLAHVWTLGRGAVAVLIIGGGLTACSPAAGATVTRLAVGQPGQDPFTLVANTDKANIAPKKDAGGTQPANTPGLYGGTRTTSSCDRDKLIAFLHDNPDKARAWAGVHNISTSDIPTFIARLTPVLLRTDTLVTNYGYRNGKATSTPAVLQAGMGVLVDGHGTPVVKCNCGNPLTRPTFNRTNLRFEGTSWEGFEPTRVTVIQTVTVVVNVFVLVNVEDTESFERPRHTEGHEDGPPKPPPVEHPRSPSGRPTETSGSPTTTPSSGSPTTSPSSGSPTVSKSPSPGTSSESPKVTKSPSGSPPSSPSETVTPKEAPLVTPPSPTAAPSGPTETTVPSPPSNSAVPSPPPTTAVPSPPTDTTVPSPPTDTSGGQPAPNISSGQPPPGSGGGQPPQAPDTGGGQPPQPPDTGGQPAPPPDTGGGQVPQPPDTGGQPQPPDTNAPVNPGSGNGPGVPGGPGNGPNQPLPSP